MQPPDASTNDLQLLLAVDAERRKEVHNLHFTITQAIKNTYSVWLIAAFITVPVWPHVPGWVCVLWVLLVGLAYTLRVRQLKPGLDLAVIQAQPALWSRRLTLWTLACGLVAALGPSLFYPALGDVARMYICMLFCCWLAGAMASLGARPRLFAQYAGVFMGGLWLAWLTSGSDAKVEVLIMLALYTLVLLGFSSNFARQVNEGVEIRFTNDLLVEQLTLARAAAEKSSAAKSRFLAVASHDLRQPLHAVTLLNGMLARPQPPERTTEISRQMGRSLATLEALFSSLLDFSKIEADKIQPELAWHRLEPLMQQLANEYAPQAANAGLGFRMSALPVAVHVDGQLLERMLRNLLDNAIKFTDSGSVAFEAANTSDGLTLTVSDTGPGIAANLQEEVFKEYYQTASDKAMSGLGLGLAIVRRLGLLMNLSVTVAANEPHGARFCVGFAASRVRLQDDTCASAAAPDVAAVDLAGYFVVYVDDDASAREALRLLLADWGCKAVVAASLPQAIEALQGQGAPDVILSDYSLQGNATGLEVIEEMRRRYGPLAGAILTGESSTTQLRLAGDFEYPVLSKPVSAHDLRGLLEVFREIG
ncbi:MAG: hybrid sensor histidine kinase/response regulator [Bdellovibrionales bacterium]|nr:hybrid sensor histidine kinase/response regulator [Ramlibacter sp.]